MKKLTPLILSAMMLGACSDLEIVTDTEEPVQPTVDRLKPIFNAEPDAEPALLSDLIGNDLSTTFGPPDDEPIDVSMVRDANEALTLARQ